MVRRMKINLFFTIVFCLLGVQTIFVYGQEEPIKFSADKIDMKMSGETNTFELSGSAIIGNTDFSITADNITVFGKDATKLEAKSDVKLHDDKNGLTGTSFWLEYYRFTGKLKMSGNVEIINPKENLVARSSYLEIAKKGAPVVLRATVRIFQDKLFARADLAIYNRRSEQLQLIGNAYISQGGEIYKTDRTTINLKTKEITLEGGISGSMSDERFELE